MSSLSDSLLTQTKQLGTVSALMPLSLALIMPAAHAADSSHSTILRVKYKQSATSWSVSNINLTSLTAYKKPAEQKTLSPLGSRLLELRQKAIQDGLKLLTADQIIQEVEERTGVV